VLAAAQEEAQARLADAESRARRVFKGARQDALNHAHQVSTTLEARADQLVEAEQSTLQRLNETRRQLSKLIEELAGADPVVGPTVEILRLAVEARASGQPALIGSPPEILDEAPEGRGEETQHPVARMVRSAVARAMDAAVDLEAEPDDDVVDGEGSTFGADETTVLADDDEAGDPRPVDADTDDHSEGDQPLYRLVAAPPVTPPAPRGRGDLTDLLSEIADIVGEDGSDGPTTAARGR